MIFRRTLLRELAVSALATFLVLLGVTVTTQLVRLLGQAASGVVTRMEHLEEECGGHDRRAGRPGTVRERACTRSI